MSYHESLKDIPANFVVTEDEDNIFIKLIDEALEEIKKNEKFAFKIKQITKEKYLQLCKNLRDNGVDNVFFCDYIYIRKPSPKNEYDILHNRFVPFRVKIDKNHATIYKYDEELLFVIPERRKMGSKNIFSFDFEELFIGKSVECSIVADDCHGPLYDGNALLFKINKTEYIYIGSNIISKFKSKQKIISFMSHVGNNLVPYTYAITDDDKAFLFIEGTDDSFKYMKFDEEKQDAYINGSESPYNEYYDNKELKSTGNVNFTILHLF